MPVNEIDLPETIAQAYAKINELVREINIIDTQLQVNITASTQMAFSGAGAPTANSDSANTDTNGVFEINSLWIDTTASPKEAYRCADATPTAAVWLNTSLEVGDLGALAILDTVDTAQIDNDAVDNTKLADMAANSIKLNDTGGAADPKDGTATEARALLNVEDGSTDDQTGSEIKAAYEGESDTNAFDDAAVSKLSGIEASADVTDAANVAAAGGAILSTANEYTATQNFNATALTALGADVVTNGGFAADTDWTKGTGWTIGSGVASSDGTQGGDADLTQALSLVSGQTYEVEFTVSNYSAGNVTPVAGDVEGTDRAANGVFTENIVAGAGGDIDIRADLDFIGDIDDVTVRLANVSWDAAANQVTKLTLDGDLVLDNPSNLVDGATYIVTLAQDGVGTRLLSYDSVFKFPGGTPPTLSTGANDVDIITFVSDGTNMYGVFQGDFS